MKTTVFMASLLLAVVIACVANVAAQAPTDDASTANAKGAITGHVVDQNGQPLANAAVSVRSYGSNSRGGTAMTDREGNFEVGGLDPYAYIVNAALPGYVTAPRDPDATPVAFYRIGDTARVEMLKGGVITGTVKKPNGDPAVVAFVRAYMIRDYKGQPPRYGIPSRLRATDDRGVYRLYGLAPGTYLVAAGGSGRSVGYSVDPYAGEVETYAPSSTRDAATEVTVNPGEEVANIDIRYREEPGHTVSGVARGGSVEQGEGYNLTLESLVNGSAQTSHQLFQPVGARGFAFTGMADGEYNLIAQQYSTAAGWQVSEARRIQVRGADVTGLDLALKPMASLAGSIVLEDSKLPECQRKRRPLLTETVIGPYHNEKTAPKDQPQFVWSLGTPVLPDKDGSFALHNLTAGQYRFNVRPLAKYWYLKSISWPGAGAASKTAQPDRPRDAARYWTTVRAGEHLTGLTVTFAEGAASLRGQIDLGEGKKLSSRTFVYLAPAESDKAEDIVRYFVVLAAADGSFNFTNLPPGHYWIIASIASDSDANMMSKLRLPDETDLRTKLRRDGEASKSQLEFIACQNVTDFRLVFK
jgi:Carboxypeptidase regulatory-like domain